jgi:hypothetical protein
VYFVLFPLPDASRLQVQKIAESLTTVKEKIKCSEETRLQCRGITGLDAGEAPKPSIGAN